MGKELKSTDQYILSSFFGGIFGTCLQITPKDQPYITLTREEALQLARAILDWEIELQRKNLPRKPL